MSSPSSKDIIISEEKLASALESKVLALVEELTDNRAQKEEAVKENQDMERKIYELEDVIYEQEESLKIE